MSKCNSVNITCRHTKRNKNDEGLYTLIWVVPSKYEDLVDLAFEEYGFESFTYGNKEYQIRKDDMTIYAHIEHDNIFFSITHADYDRLNEEVYKNLKSVSGLHSTPIETLDPKNMEYINTDYFAKNFIEVPYMYEVFSIEVMKWTRHYKEKFYTVFRFFDEEDILQNLSCKVLTNNNNYVGKTKYFGGYIRTMVNNLLKDLLKKYINVQNIEGVSLDAPVGDDGSSLHNILSIDTGIEDNTETVIMFNTTLRKVEDTTREVIVLLQRGFSESQVASMLGVHINSVSDSINSFKSAFKVLEAV